MPKPIPKPSRTEEVLATVAARYPAGVTVTLPVIAEVGNVKLARRPCLISGISGNYFRWLLILP